MVPLVYILLMSTIYLFLATVCRPFSPSATFKSIAIFLQYIYFAAVFRNLIENVGQTIILSWELFYFFLELNGVSPD